MQTYLMVKQRNGRVPHSMGEVTGKLDREQRAAQFDSSRWFLVLADSEEEARTLTVAVDHAIHDPKHKVPRKLKARVVALGRGMNP